MCTDGVKCSSVEVAFGHNLDFCWLIYIFYYQLYRSLMDASGENMDKKWPKEIHVLGLIIAAPWQLLVPFANKYSSLLLITALDFLN